MKLRATSTYLLAAGLMTALLFTACGGEEDVPTPAAPKTATKTTPVPAPPQPAPPVTPDELPPPVDDIVAQFEGKIDLPDYYPEDAPSWPGVQLTEARLTADGKASVVWSIADTEEAIQEFAKSSMAENGWEIIFDEQLDHGHMIQAKKGERLLSLVTTPLKNSGRTILAIAVEL